MTGWMVLMALIGLMFAPVVEEIAAKFVGNRTVRNWIVLLWVLLWTIPPLFNLWTKGTFG